MAAPRRHGQRWMRGPTPTPSGGDARAIRSTGRGPTPTGPAPPQQRIIPVKQMDAWMRTLPPEAMTHLILSDEVRYNAALGVGGEMSFASNTVAEDYTWVFTDVHFYATAPAAEMYAPPKNLSAEALVGLIQLELTFGGTSPLRTRSSRMSPYATPAQFSAGPSTTSGWPWLETDFGVRRMPSFAIYAEGNEEIRVVATITNEPLFPITRLGVNLHGFSVPSGLLPGTWK